MRRLFPVLAALPAVALASANDDWAALVDRAKEENKTCESAYLKAETAGGELKENDEGDRYFADASKTLRVAEELRRYQGASKSAAEAMRRLNERLSRGGSPSEYALVFQIPTCRTIGYFKLGKALAEGAKRYSLGADGDAAVRAAVLSYVAKDLDNPLPLIDVMIRIALLEKLQEVKLVPPEKVVALHKRADKVRRAVREKSEKWDSVNDLDVFRTIPAADQQAIAALWLEEVKETDKLRAALKALVAELGAPG